MAEIGSDYFHVRMNSDDVEIITKDKLKIYCLREWLNDVSFHFVDLMRSNKKNCIDIPYRYEILLLVFQYIDKSKLKVPNFERTIFCQIICGEDLCEFLHMCHEYMLDSIKKSADKYFSNEEKIKKFFCNELIVTVSSLKMKLMKKTIRKLLHPGTYSAKLVELDTLPELMKLIGTLDFKSMECQTLQIFTELNVLIWCFEKWIAHHQNVSDEELSTADLFDFSEIPPRFTVKLISVIDKCNNAPKYQLGFFRQIALGYKAKRMENSSMTTTGNNTEQISLHSFSTKNQFDDLEIITKDKVILYCSKGWLLHLSIFFNTLLTGAFRETNAPSITLKCNSEILTIVLQCAYHLQHGTDFLERNIFERISTKDNLCDFLSICNLYQLYFIKDLADKYFSNKNFVRKFFSIELIEIVDLVEMKLMKKTINEFLDPAHYTQSMLNEMLIETMNLLDFKTMTSVQLNLLGSSWTIFLYCFEKWVDYHENVTSKELNSIRILNDLLDNMIKIHTTTLIKIIRKCVNAKEYQLIFFEKILLRDYDITPDENKKDEDTKYVKASNTDTIYHVLSSDSDSDSDFID